MARLDWFHGFYEREFVRRRKTKKNNDGFDHRPTFTLPHATSHPRWFVFNAPQISPPGYRNLILPETKRGCGLVELLLVSGEKTDGKYPFRRLPVQFRANPRLLAFRRVKVQKLVTRGQNKGQQKETDAYVYFDSQLKQPRPAEISGAKLMLKKIRLNSDGSLKSAVPYLYFTCTIQDLPFTEKARTIKWSETGEITKRGKRRKRKKLPEGLVACAVDLGLRHLGFATLAVHENGAPRILRSRNIWVGAKETVGRHRGRWSPGPELAHIAGHKRKIRRLRTLRGKPVKGEQSHVELQRHITNMGEDRFKRAARSIVNYALNVDDAANSDDGEVYPRADVLVLENLEGFIPDAARERGINRALVAWNRGNLVERVKEMAKDAGLRLFEVSPVGTSQVCSRCGGLGRRYSIVKNQQTHRPDIRFGWVEKLFACSECGYRANADHNAAVNLHRRFLLEDKAVESYYEWRKQSAAKRRQVVEQLESGLLDPLRQMHRLDGSVGPVPF